MTAVDDFDGGDEIRFERRGRAGIVTLTRPKALNAVTHGMVRALARALSAWENDGAVALVVIRGEGRAFSAGGDILHIYEAGRRGEPLIDFFADEYRLNAQIRRFPKPYVALIDGIVMGGGVGVSFHGSHRVMTENARFAMPECGIGFFPDVGGAYILPRLKGETGLWLGLTGERVGAGDSRAIGLATHTAKAADLPAIVDALAETGDPAVLDRFHADMPSAIEPDRRAAIDRFFAANRLERLVERLEGEATGGDAFAATTLATLRKRSPLSLFVAFRQIREGARLDMDACMGMEFRIVSRMLAGHDFYEGIRAVVVDKDNAPRWRPSTLSDVAAADVEAYFAPLKAGELDP